MVVIVVILFPFITLNAKGESWKSSKSNLKYVLVPAVETANIELIRLYQDKSFEHLVYVPDRKYVKGKEDFSNVHRSNVKRNVGTYSIVGGQINLNCKEQNFPTDIYKKDFAFIDNKVYTSKFQSVFQKKNYLLKTVSKTKYAMPFYLDPYSHLVVSNKEAGEKIDMTDLAKYITNESTNDFAKFKALSDFLKKAVSYDENYTFSSELIPETEIAGSVIAGSERTANSFLLSKSYEFLGKLAGLNIRTINGLLKREKGFSVEKRKHTWNELTIGEKRMLVDISLGENWTKVAPVMMISTHFPDKKEDQLIEKPITELEFDALAPLEPTKPGVVFSQFMPSKSSLFAKNKVEIIFEELLSSVKVESYEFNQQKGEFSDNATLISTSKIETVYGKSKLTIPINFKVGKLVLSTSSGMKISYFVSNNGIEETEVSTYLKTLISNKKPINTIPAPKNNVAAMNTTTKSSKTTWENSEDVFLNDLATHQFSDLRIVENPLISEARKFYGLKEIDGSQHNKSILNFFKETGNGKIKTDEDAWCSVFMGYCAKKAGLEYSKKLLAKSWLDIGSKVIDPKPGDIVVFWRENPDSWQGHVAIYLGKDLETNEIICLGGNQDNEVCIRQYAADRVLGYRKLTH